MSNVQRYSQDPGPGIFCGTDVGSIQGSIYSVAALAYNIGSVQPSIKVTHIIKHSIYVAPKEDIEIFDSVARDITKIIFANCQENEALKQMRDTLLPKLMSGELDVSNIEL